MKASNRSLSRAGRRDRSESPIESIGMTRFSNGCGVSSISPGKGNRHPRRLAMSTTDHGLANAEALDLSDIVDTNRYPLHRPDDPGLLEAIETARVHLDREG